MTFVAAWVEEFLLKEGSLEGSYPLSEAVSSFVTYIQKGSNNARNRMTSPGEIIQQIKKKLPHEHNCFGRHPIASGNRQESKEHCPMLVGVK
jgi:hypothetical protein